MAELISSTVDSNVAVLLNPREPRSFRNLAVATGNADTLVLKGHISGNIKGGIYDNDPANNRPKNLLATFPVTAVTANNEVTISLSASVPMTSGTAYHLVLVQEGSNSCARGGTVASFTRYTGATLATIGTALPTLWSHVTSTASTTMPYFKIISSLASITIIDQLIEAENSSITFSDDFDLTGITVSDGEHEASATGATGSGSEWDIIAPALTHGDEGPRLGAVTVTATDGVNTTDPFADTYSKAGYTTVILTSASEFNYLAGFSPALKAGSQVAYDPTKGEIAVDGVYSGDYEGSQIIWDHDPDDGIWRSANIVTSGGSVVPPGGLTARGLTVIGLSVSGLSVRGL